MKLILTRHTSTDWNVQGIIQGQTDNELNAFGIEEAEIVARPLSGFPIDLILCSDLKRSVQTAEIIRKFIGLEASLKIDPRLRECSFGNLEGVEAKEVLKRHGSAVLGTWEGCNVDYDYRPHGGSHHAEVLARHRAVIDELTANGNKFSTVLIVGHGRGIDTLLASFRQPVGLKRGEYRVIEIEA